MSGRKQPNPAPGSPDYRGIPQVKPAPPPAPPRRIPDDVASAPLARSGELRLGADPFELENEREAFVLLDLINAEFCTDPNSVTCFDLRVVERVRRCVDKRRRAERRGLVPRVLEAESPAAAADFVWTCETCHKSGTVRIAAPGGETTESIRRREQATTRGRCIDGCRLTLEAAAE